VQQPWWHWGLALVLVVGGGFVGVDVGCVADCTPAPWKDACLSLNAALLPPLEASFLAAFAAVFL
jgi:hypothetical protein